MSESNHDPSVEISVICPVTRNATELGQVHSEFSEALSRIGRSVEFIYVVDGPHTGAESQLAELTDQRFAVRVFRLAKGFGEATALQFGFERARGELCLTIADRPQVEASVVATILEKLEGDTEIVVTRREPRSDAFFNRLQSRIFHALIRRLIWQDFQDMSCGIRGLRTEAARKLDLYGDQHRFLPVLAVRCGFQPLEIPAPQHPQNRKLRLYGLGVYARRLLDIVNVVFLVRFTRKPLRFFGGIGSLVGMLGFAICLLLAAQRLFGDSSLADRPLLLLGVLLIVLGVQVASIGLLGEIIIFLSAKREIPEASEHEVKPKPTVA